MSSGIRVGIVGAGLGGVTAAGLLSREGFDVVLFDQAPSFSRLGAGIQFGPNVLKILRRLDGLDEKLEKISCLPDYWVSRKWDDGTVMAKIPLNAERTRYGAPYITIHRGDLHQAMLDCLSPEQMRWEHKLVDFVDGPQGVNLLFDNGMSERVDILVGADGINSCIRDKAFGTDADIYTGWIAHRAVIPGEVAQALGADDNAKWWGPDRHIVCYYLDANKSEFYLVTGEPGEWTNRTGQLPSTREALKAAFEGFHPMVQGYIDAADTVTKWPLKTREPLASWSKGRVVLLGDACHPMKPHMAQGAAMAVEDAAVLTLCLGQLGTADLARTFDAYYAARKPRATKVQTISNANSWLKDPEDPYWCYGDNVYDLQLTA